MSFIASPGSVSSNPTEAATTVRSAPAPAAAAPIKAEHTPAQDTVRLSVAAQVVLMRHQGQSITTIAANLGTSVASVDSYLGIKATAQPLTPAASPESESSTAASKSASATEAATPAAPSSPTAKA